MKKLALAAIAVLALAGCNANYKKLGPEYGATPPCDRPTYVVTPRGDFSDFQKQDIMSAAGEIGFWSNRQVFYMGDVDFRSGDPRQFVGTVVVERDSAIPTGYALPGKFVKLGNWISSWGSPSEPSYSIGYTTFRGGVLHEMLHALVGAEDMYNEGDGNPGLIMGKGYLRFNKMALGDILAAKAGGCP